MEGIKRPSSPSVGLPTGLGMGVGVGVPSAPGQGNDGSNIFAAVTQQFSKEIEDEANSYFQRIYNHPPHPTITIDEVLDMLKRFKDSPVKKERVSCMVSHCIILTA